MTPYPHQKDAVWWYRFANAAWRFTITLSATLAILLTMWWLTEHGDLTSQSIADLDLAFTVLSYGLLVGYGLVGVDLIGPHALHDGIKRGVWWSYTKVVEVFTS